MSASCRLIGEKNVGQPVRKQPPSRRFRARTKCGLARIGHASVTWTHSAGSWGQSLTNAPHSFKSHETMFD